jgi:hypothetical protein
MWENHEIGITRRWSTSPPGAPVGGSWSETVTLLQGGHRIRGRAKTAEPHAELRVLARAVALFPAFGLDHSAPDSVDTPNRLESGSSYSGQAHGGTPAPALCAPRHSPCSKALVIPNTTQAPDHIATSPSREHLTPVLTLTSPFPIIARRLYQQPIPNHPKEPRV